MSKFYNLAVVFIFLALAPFTSFAQSGGFAVTARGADYKVLSQTTVEHGTNRIHSYTELASGMNYQNAGGQWTEAREQISILPQGGAAAVQGRHQVYFPPDIYNGVLEVVTPDGRHLRSRPVGVSYDDGSNVVWIAQLKHSIGWLTKSNQVTYADAFTQFKADLVCTYRRGGFECDLVFRQQPPTPDVYGLAPDTSTLQLVTEFFNTQDPQQIPAQSDDWFGLQDNTLKFGKLTMTHGKAFAVGGSGSNSGQNNGQSRLTSAATSVYKSWLHLEGRTFLIEEVPLGYLADDLDTLPEATNALTSLSSPATRHSSLARQMPPGHEPMAETNQIQIAAIDLNKQPGVVLDYDEINTDQSDFTFASGTTYYISGAVNLGGTTTIEAGTTVKIPESGLMGDNDVAITCNGDVICNTTADRPAIFTSINDNTVGEVVAGSSGTPSHGYIIYLWLTSAVTPLQHLWMLYENVGIYFDVPDTALEITDAQFLHTGSGCFPLDGGQEGMNLTLNNVLFHDCGGGVYNEGGYDITVNGTFVTLDQIAQGLVPDSSWWPSTVSASLTDSLLTGVGSTNDLTLNNSAVLDSGDGVYETSGIFNNYLAADSPYRDIGTGDVDSGLLSLIQTLTTYSPPAGGVPDTDTPDLGYHYPPVLNINIDADLDGLPDWWEWQWFGSYALSGTNLDAAGNTLLYDYQNGLDPNVIKFSTDVANNYVPATSTISLALTAGLPSYRAVLIDSTNFDGATWNAYTTSNLTVNLGSVQGWHEIWIGLKGPATNASITWVWKRLKLDTVPPRLTITSPTNSTVKVPMIQIAGFCPEPLDHISYDITNALGLVTNLDAGITRQFYDTNTWDFTTNYFEALDIPLTNGANKIIFHATDLAGNVTVTNFTFTVDYTGKTNPVVQVTWPSDGMKLCGTNLTLRGQVDDPTVSVYATMTDTNGNTNILEGLVERNGRFWLEAVPLNSGTNHLSIMVSNVIGQMTLTNINVLKSSVTLTMNPVTDAAQLWQPTVNVSGHVSDTSVAVWVNGVQGTNNGDGTWSAGNVPTSSGGVANFDMTAYPAGEAPSGSLSGTSSVNPQTANANNGNVSADKPVRLYVLSDGQAMAQDMNYHATGTDGSDVRRHEWQTYQHFWLDGAGGFGYIFAGETLDGNYDGPMENIYAHTNLDQLTFDGLGVGNSAGTVDDDGVIGFTGPVNIWELIGNEHCVVKDPFNREEPVLDTTGQQVGLLTWHETYVRGAQTIWHLETGGKAGSARQNLFCLSGSATAIGNKRTVPYGWDVDPRGTPISPPAITIDGMALGADGKQWRTYPDNTDHDVTPRVKNKDFYTFTVDQQKYLLTHLTECTAVGNADNTRTLIGIGEKVDFSGMPSDTQWSLSGGGSLSTASGGSTVYTASLSPGSATVTAQVGTAQQSLSLNIIPPDSVIVSSYSDNPDYWGVQDIQGIYMGARTDYTVIIGPKKVSFNGVTIRENAPASVPVTWPNGVTLSVRQNAETSGITLTCGSLITDQIAQGLFNRSLLLTNGNYVNFSYNISWVDQYSNNLSGWTDFAPVTVNVEFRQSDRKSRVIYQGFPSQAWEGPFQ